ncbi:uncharacterized protein Z518_02694 [Rhinocladiella mackenziei CBS 650.93]|uniref:Plastocyanin-like domain-containing protein n=1 Tax=Rhinocladiella mackenziei CBS 650.93 TaxID=1442369 RepID=A0A0D2IQ83_9EURO|nr:uncharacterized protein Z518_02694 [Rhinocladiella mackenziei CBS 650.93]KIX08039.1 hypothetical protein Z518_02694 [Rhinocladiella mackenziei CBS 650.93]
MGPKRNASPSPPPFRPNYYENISVHGMRRVVISGPALVKHDADFIPDIVLRASVETIQLNCHSRLSTLLNGSYPAPPIYLGPDQTTWIRVYNDADVNTTMGD